MSPAAATRQLLAGPRRLLHHLGRRGGYLLTLGSGWVGYGASITVNARYGTSRGIAILTRVAPIPFWGWLWIAAGLLAITAGLRRGALIDTIGYVCISIPPALWGAAYAVAWYTGAYQPVWGSAIAWLSEVGGFVIVSGWVELPRATIRAMRGKGPQHGG
ncbi:hypothetical protein ACEZCY_14780 [Streptacidiphilus sp. N1-12]|uniref:Uncharacterized protein n=2 Tax=Streptacidiphilus alkalitolerans TaxID=3342712 RepID=A0ABV6WEN2_9ACTN